MGPEMLRELLVTENVELAAHRVGLPLSIAHAVRVQAMNLVLGRCVLCNKNTKMGLCSYCQKFAPHAKLTEWLGMPLLRHLRPADQLVRQTCSSCGVSFKLSAAYLLRRLRQDTPTELKSTCRGCDEKAKAPLEPQPLEEAIPTSVEDSQPPPPQVTAPAEGEVVFTHKPFEGNELFLKLRGSLPEKAKKPLPSKKGQNAIQTGKNP